LGQEGEEMVDQRALATLPMSSADLWRGRKCSELGNAASPVLGHGNGVDADVEDALAKPLVRWFGQKRDEERW
jgi:hypothetical protein